MGGLVVTFYFLSGRANFLTNSVVPLTNHSPHRGIMNPPFSEITSFSELTKRSTAYDTPSTNVRSIVKQEIDKAQAKNSLDNADKANKSIVDTPEFKTGLDNYFEEIDKSNQTCRCITFWSMLTFGVLTTFIIIMVDVFVNNGYQEFDPIVGFVTSSVSGVALAKSPLMSASDAIVYDARDIVVPPKEKNALFVTTKSYAVEKQARGTCMGMDKCECLSPDKDCSQCLRGSSGMCYCCYCCRCVATLWLERVLILFFVACCFLLLLVASCCFLLLLVASCCLICRAISQQVLRGCTLVVASKYLPMVWPRRIVGVK